MKRLFENTIQNKSGLIHNSNCTRCALHATAQTVCIIGQGIWREPYVAPIMLVGEAPGSKEDSSGIPFVGESGHWLRERIDEVGISTFTYITNAVKCRPPNNRCPARTELEACQIYLRKEIKVLKPKIIVTLGRTAAAQMGWAQHAIGDMFYSNHRWGDFYCRLTYHPAYYLRTRSTAVEENIVESLKWAKLQAGVI